MRFGLKSLGVTLLVLGIPWGGFSEPTESPDRFYWALYNNDLKKVTELLQAGRSSVDPLPTGDLPLAVAASRGHREAMEFLLEGGASPLTLDKDLTPVLSLAIQAGRLDSARLLVRYGADPDQLDRWGRSSLWYALQSNNPRLLQQVLLYRPNLEATDIRGRTLLMHAVETASQEMVKTLLDLGADPWRVDYFGKSSLEHAQIRDDPGILLMVKMARGEG